MSWFVKSWCGLWSPNVPLSRCSPTDHRRHRHLSAALGIHCTACFLIPALSPFAISGVWKDHCWAQWNLGRETAKDGGNPYGEVGTIRQPCLSFCVSVTRGPEIWPPSLPPPLLQSGCFLSVWVISPSLFPQPNPLKFRLSFPPFLF